MEDLLPFALLCFTSFFTLTNPLGTMPVFLTMTNGMNDHERKAIVRRATIVSFITLMVFTFSGQFLFKFFGISSNGFRIAGGFIIFKIGFDMLQARYSNAKLKEEEVKTYADDISITPLAIPMLCGPGAIANAIMLMDDASTFTLKGTLIGIIALVYFITFLILQASTRLVRILGETGNNVMMRLMGLILMVIAVECFVSGLKPILIDILREAMGYKLPDQLLSAMGAKYWNNLFLSSSQSEIFAFQISRSAWNGRYDMISWVCVVPFEIVIFLDLAYRFISFIFCCPSGVVS